MKKIYKKKIDKNKEYQQTNINKGNIKHINIQKKDDLE
jgi:hypothetical protein